MAASNRSFAVEPRSAQNTIQDGDSPICSVVSPQGRLDGLHRFKGCISSSSNASGIQKISSVHGIRQSLPIQGSLLWSVHGSAGLHAGHGSGFGDSSQSWNSASTISGRLADSGVLPRAGSSCSEDGPPIVKLSGDSCQLGEVSACADSENALPRNPVGLCQFPGFSSPETSRQASLNWRRISIRRKSACEILARVSGGSVLYDLAHSGGTAADAVVPACASSRLGSLGSRSFVRWSPENRQDLLWWLDHEWLEFGISLEQVSPQLDLWSDASDVGWGGASRRGSSFRPLVSRGAAQLHQPSGVVSDLLGAPAFSASGSEHLSGSLCSHYNSAGLPAESGGHHVCGIEPDSAGSPALGGAPFNFSPTSIYYGTQQCVGRLSLSSTSGSGFRVEPETACVSTTSEKMAGVDRPICNLSKSPLLTLFFSVPRSQCSWDGCSSPTVGWVAGVCLSSICSYSCDSEKAPLVLWGPADNHSSVLAPEAVVSGASGACSGRSSGSASGQGSLEPASCAPSTSGSVKASDL